MTETFFVKPATKGADIRDPETNDRLPAKGGEKPRDPYWLGLVHRGDVVELDPPAEPEAKRPAAAGKPD